MKVVVYTTDLEPITVIDIPMWGIERMRKDRFFRVPVIEPFKISSIDDVPIQGIVHHVDIWAEPLRRGNRESLMIFTYQDELALKLFGEPLPGQQRSFQEQYRKGFIDGLLAALER